MPVGLPTILSCLALVVAATPTATTLSNVEMRGVRSRELGTFQIELGYEARGIDFGDWITLLTLCLAPVVVHLIAGVPEPIILSGNPPRWIHRVCHYNPTSILWRYFVILDRRVRCRKWTAEDMAASNAHFWTGTSWDTGEEIMIRSRQRLIHKPSSTHIDFLSYSAIETLIVTLQGIQSLYYIIISSTSNKFENGYSNRLSLANILQPFAIFGLLRLPVALWLSETHAYRYTEDEAMMLEEPERSDSTKASSEMCIVTSNYLRPAHGPLGLATRILYLVPLLALAVYTTYWVFPTMPNSKGIERVTAPYFAHIAFFSAFLNVTFLIFLAHIVCGKSRTTVIPCHDTLWYRTYTFSLYIGMLMLILVAALGTRKSDCGFWTTMLHGNDRLCHKSENIEILGP